MALSCIAQDGYPKQILLNREKLVLFTPKQVSLINYNKVSLDECTELNKSYIKEIASLKLALNASLKVETNLLKKNSYQGKVISEQVIQVELLEESNRELRSKLKSSKTLRYIYTAGSAVGGFYLGIKFVALITP